MLVLKQNRRKPKKIWGLIKSVKDRDGKKEAVRSGWCYPI